MSRASDAIARSRAHGEIVTLHYDSDAYADLVDASDDRVATEDVTEFWANDPDDENAMAWRVHMRHADPESDGDRAYDEARDREFVP